VRAQHHYLLELIYIMVSVICSMSRQSCQCSGWACSALRRAAGSNSGGVTVSYTSPHTPTCNFIMCSILAMPAISCKVGRCRPEQAQESHALIMTFLCAASVHAGLASLVEREGENLEGRRILMYSYGSGLAASLWSVVGRKVEGKFALSNISSKVRRPCCQQSRLVYGR